MQRAEVPVQTRSAGAVDEMLAALAEPKSANQSI